MKIESATLHRLEIPMKGSYRAAVHDFSRMDSVLVVLETADGVRGIGTADPSPGYSRQTTSEIWHGLEERVLPTLLDHQPRTPSEAAKTLDTIEGDENARCAAEMAYLDAYGKVHGESVASYFGGTTRSHERLNAWIGIDEPEAMAANAVRWRNRGFQSLKLKLDGNAERDVERVRAVVDAVGDAMQIRADVNGAYDVDEASEALQALEDVPLAHLEQPVPQDDIDSLAHLTETYATPVMADESLMSLDRVREVLDREAADRLKLKPLRLGGLSRTKEALELAASRDIECVVGHGFGLMPATSAEIQLTSTQENVFRPVESVGQLKMTDEPFDSAFSLEEGRITLDSDAGLGVTVRDDRLAEVQTESAQIR
jgi:L-alanine-DL-glutamate epimerase-like enolase superfamily enzyme